tara:strand:- start:380 stop:961 length:582 start_codon:yes stop_codon:yes gene_type:complete
MKTFNEYLTESKKVYSFNVKVAGEVPEGFCDRLKSCVASREVVTCEEMSKTPVTEVPMDFPELNNMEVTTFNLVTNYPITPQEVHKACCEDCGCAEDRCKVRNSASPTEEYQINDDKREGALLHDNEYKEAGKIKYKDYFGDDFNKSFLKDLQKTSKERKKELGHDKLKADVFADVPKIKIDKAGVNSPVGSK